MGATILKERKEMVRNEKVDSRKNRFCTQSEDITLLQNIIHDLKMPLTLIYMDTKELEKQETTKHQDIKRIKRIKKNCYRITKLVNDACDSGRIASGNFKARYESCDIVALIKGTADSVQPIAEFKNIKLEFEFDNDIKLVEIDPGLLERILLNLLSNAFKYTEKGGTIRIIFNDLGDVIRIAVRDEGGGFNLSVLKQCFNRYITEYSENNARGSGIGLSIVRQFVDIMGGEISVNNLKRGAEVSLLLPVSMSEDAEPSQKDIIVNDFYLDNIVDIEMSEL